MILKSWYSLRLTLVLLWALLLFPNIIAMLVGGGMSASDGLSTPGQIIYIMFNCVNIICFSMLPVSVLSEDLRVSWMKYQLTAPLDFRSVAAGSMLPMLLVIFGAAVCNSVTNLLCGLLFDMDLELIFAAPLCIGCVQAISAAVAIPFIFRTEGRLASLLYVAITVVIIVAAAFGVTALLGCGAAVWLFRVVMYLLLPCITVAAVFGSIRLTEKQMRSVY